MRGHATRRAYFRLIRTVNKHPCRKTNRFMDIKSVQQQLREFAEARDWEQFHSPKNLAVALAVEAAELMEPFQWLTEDESRHLGEKPAEYAQVSEEIADVLIYLLRLADQLDIDLEQAVYAKMRKNGEKYPVTLARGNAVKYNRRQP